LYNYLFAKGQGGVCILRIEDTDRTRFVEGAIEEQISSLAWAGVIFDEGPHVGGEYGPYTQSERFDLYRQYGMQLVENGTAYYAFDTSEELDAMRKRQQDAGIAPKYAHRCAISSPLVNTKQHACLRMERITSFVSKCRNMKKYASTTRCAAM
jgi:glutamyl-tRNA synthetase